MYKNTFFFDETALKPNESIHILLVKYILTIHHEISFEERPELAKPDFASKRVPYPSLLYMQIQHIYNNYQCP